MAACSNDEGDATVDNERVPLRIVSSISVEQSVTTRAANSAWEAADQIGIFCTEDNNTANIYTDVTPTTCNNLPYIFDDGTNYETSGTNYRAFTGTTVYLPANGTNIDVYAYYPYKAQDSNSDGIDDLSPTAVPINVATQTWQKAIDFMRAAVADRNTNNNTAELTFQHKLVKLQFNLKQGTDMLPDEIINAFTNGNLSVAIGGQPTAATYNIYTDVLSITAGSTGITATAMTDAATGYDKSFEAIVLPNKMTAEGDELANNTAADRTVTIIIGTTGGHPLATPGPNYTFTFTIPGGTTFIAGNKYTYNVTVNTTSIQVNPAKYTEQW